MGLFARRGVGENLIGDLAGEALGVTLGFLREENLEGHTASDVFLFRLVL